MTADAASTARMAAIAADVLATHGDMPLLALPDGRVLSIAEGYIPRLVNFTEEDKAAKGLRSLKEQPAEPPPPVHFTALEVVQDEGPLLLLGERGSGRTTFARHLACGLAAAWRRSGTGALPDHMVARNDVGARALERWTSGRMLPLLMTVDGPARFRDLLLRHWPDAEDLAAAAPVLLMVDGAERLGEAGPAFLADAAAFAGAHPSAKLLVLGERRGIRPWRIPPGFRQHALLPFPAAERRAFDLAVLRPRGVDGAWLAADPLAASPALFALSLAVGRPATTPGTLIDQWLEKAGPQAGDVDLAAACFAAMRNDGEPSFGGAAEPATIALALRSRLPVALVAARHLAGRPPDEAAALFHDDPRRWTDTVASLLRRIGDPDRRTALVRLLVAGDRDSALHGAILAAGLPDASNMPEVPAALLRLVERGRLPAADRAEAGRILARLGDPRDLEALCAVAGGPFVMGSRSHPNSEPVHRVTVAPFRIGMYPVTNACYGRFVAATGRPWLSKDGLSADRANAPAVDLTWRDARAYCDWLTVRWRGEGRIGADETVRLPTEAEWERAARGDQPDAGGIVYPWGGPWDPDAANCDETGFNDTSAVGLFPKGRSPYGCHDMAGQVWEWTSTLWGSDMATPTFRYPYTDDGREAPDAGPEVRRVLRGGCFSSGWPKACCTYRGSLEPDGFWRGNGFRIVVARA